MNIVEKEIMIFKNESGKYSFQVSKKNQDGSYDKAYFPIQFNKDIELENKTLIRIKNAWLSFYNWEYEGKKGTTFFIKCSEFEEIEKQESQPVQEEQEKLSDETFKEFGETIEISQEELPF